MHRKIIALLLMQVYMVAAFGLTLGEKICCEQPVSEASCHVEMAESLPAPLDIDHEQCPVCPDQALLHEENCCPDCASLFVAVDNESRLEQSFANNQTLLTQQSLQAAIILLPWINASAATLTLYHNIPLRDTESSLSPTDIPIFIRDCTYRI